MVEGFIWLPLPPLSQDLLCFFSDYDDRSAKRERGTEREREKGRERDLRERERAERRKKGGKQFLQGTDSLEGLL